MIDIDEDLFDLFFTTLPQDLQPLHNNFQYTMTELKKRLIKIHREVCLLPFYSSILDPNGLMKQMKFPAISNADLLLSLFNPQETSSFVGLFLISQNTSFLIHYLNENPNEFARELANSNLRLDQGLFYHLVYAIIPSLFGFFHSSENLDYAVLFYQNVIEYSDNPVMILRILPPFFNNASTYRYIEYVLTNFFRKVNLTNKNSRRTSSLTLQCQEIRKPDDLIRDKNTLLLLKYLKKGIPLLPYHHLKLFKLIKNKFSNQWTKAHWFNFLFKKFISPNFNRWSRAHFYDISNSDLPSSMNQPLTATTPFLISGDLIYNLSMHASGSTTEMINSTIDEINHIVSNVNNEDLSDEFNNFISLLCASRSSYEPPQVYDGFKQLSMQCYVCVNDIKILVEFLHSKNILPTCIDVHVFDTIPIKYQYIWFFCNIYPTKKIDNNAIIFPRVVFPHVQINRDFDSKIDNPSKIKMRYLSLRSLAKDNMKNEFVLINSKHDNEFHEYSKKQIFCSFCKLADSYEEHIEHMRLKSEIDKWFDLSKSCLEFLCLAYSCIIKKNKEALTFLPSKVKLLHHISNVNEKHFQKQFDSIYKFSKDWDFFIHQLISSDYKIDSDAFNHDIRGNISKDHNSILKTHERLPQPFIRNLSIFSTISDMSFPEKCVLFMQALRQIQEISPPNDNYFFYFLIQKVPGRVLLSLFIELGIIIVLDEASLRYLTNTEKTIWQRFESILYLIATQNDSIFQNLLRLQKEFHNSYSAWKSQAFGKNSHSPYDSS